MVHRYMAAPLLEALSDTPVVLLHGVRQSGKSTLARWVAAEARPSRYLTLDDVSVLSAARSDPEGFLRGLDCPIVLDEVQRAPDLFLAMKAEVDRHRRPGRFLLTGSANVMLLPRIADSLAGRLEILTLWPFSQAELAGGQDNFVDDVFANKAPAAGGGCKDLISRILLGGYPAVHARPTPARRRAWLGSYLTTILQRDVRDLANVDFGSLPRLLALLASRVGSTVNFADLSRDAAIPQTTLKRYWYLLEATFLIQTSPPWSVNIGKRLVKSPKLYLTDTGLIAYLLGLDERRLDQDRNLLGPLLENFVVLELHKQSGWSRTRPKLLHFRIHAGPEVDVVLEDAAGRLVGIEVKAAASLSADDFKGLRALAEIAGRRFHRGIVLYTGRESVPFGPQLHALPIDSLWAVRGHSGTSRRSSGRPTSRHHPAMA